MTRSQYLSLPLLLLFLGACASRPATPPPADASRPNVIVLSFDGLPASTIGEGSMPTLDRLAREGVHAEWMSPAFPTLTFPNHYTLATGLLTDRHGIVNNYIRDPDFGDYHSKRNGSEGRWYGGEPIWTTLERQGGRAGVLSWVGGQDPDDPRVASLMVPFTPDRTPADTVRQLLAWLDLPAESRPRLLMAYFDRYDIAGHTTGPASPEATEAKTELDAALTQLLSGLQARGRLHDTNLIVLSDHGMQAVPPENVDWLDPRIPHDAYDVVGTMVIGVFPKPGREAEVDAMVGRHAHHACHRKGEMPAHWRHGRHDRVPPIICAPDVGWYLFAREPQRRYPHTRGEHGFDPLEPSMRAVFVANGPSFRQGATIPAFDNVDVYPLLAHLLDVEPADNDGTLEPLLDALRPPAH